MKFLLTDKDLSKLREKPCQTDWMEFAEEFDNKLSAVPLPLSAHLGKRLQGVTFLHLSFWRSNSLLSLFHSFTMQMCMVNVHIPSVPCVPAVAAVVLLLSSLLLLVAYVTAVVCIPAVAGIATIAGVTLVPDVITVAGLSAIAGVHDVVGVHAVSFVPAVACVPAFAGFPALAGVFAVDGVRVDSGVPIVAEAVRIRSRALNIFIL
jgi:hypothetical protein